MHLADAFIQSDLLRLYIYCQYVCYKKHDDSTFENT